MAFNLIVTAKLTAIACYRRVWFFDIRSSFKAGWYQQTSSGQKKKETTWHFPNFANCRRRSLATYVSTNPSSEFMNIWESAGDMAGQVCQKAIRISQKRRPWNRFSIFQALLHPSHCCPAVAPLAPRRDRETPISIRKNHNINNSNI